MMPENIYGESIRKKYLNLTSIKILAQDIPDMTVKVTSGIYWDINTFKTINETNSDTI